MGSISKPKEHLHKSSIRSVRLSKDSVLPGESFHVNVKLENQNKQCTVTINGSFGSLQWFQFHGKPGQKKISVKLYDEKSLLDSRTLSISLLEPKPGVTYPQIKVDSAPEKGMNFAKFSLTNFDEIHKPGAIYVWDFGIAGQQSANTNQPIVQSFEGCMTCSNLYETQHVSVTVQYPDQSQRSAKRSFFITNTYVIMRKSGVISPIPVYDRWVHPEKDKLVAHCTVRNDEDDGIHILEKAFELLNKDMDPKDHISRFHKVDIRIKPKDSTTIDCSVPRKVLQNAFGYAVHFSGKSASGLDVRFTCYFQYREAVVPVTVNEPSLIKVLDDLRAQRINAGKTSFSRDEVDTHARLLQQIDVSSDSNPMEALKLLIDANLSATNMKLTSDDLIGKECLPDEDAPFDDLACQLTDEWAMVTIPPMIANARRGETLLTGGGNFLSTPYLNGTTPPSFYTHCGIMTKNFYEITHCTLADTWMMHSLIKILDDYVWPEGLKYGWPGTISQNIDQAYNGDTRLDPNGEIDSNTGDTMQHYIQPSFSTSSMLGPEPDTTNNGIIHPVVLRVSAKTAQTVPTAVATLEKIAMAAKEIKAHFSLFAHSVGSVSSGRTIFNAPDRGPSWWASRTRPASAASWVWAVIKSVADPQIQLEGPDRTTAPGDLESYDVATGAEVNRYSTDGLYLYQADERLNAAKQLYNVVEYWAESNTLGDFWPWNASYGDEFANQFCNTLMSNWADKDAKDSTRWKDGPVIAESAVSPADILHWDKPGRIDEKRKQYGVYDLIEPVKYIPAHVEFRRISRWVRVKPNPGTIEGTVVYRGRPAPEAVITAGGLMPSSQQPISDVEGRFRITVKGGSYYIGAGKIIGGLWASGKTEVTVAAGDVVSGVIIEMQDPPEVWREVVVSGSLAIKDDETFGDEYNSWRLFRNGLYVSPDAPRAQYRFTQGFSGEIYTELLIECSHVAPTSVNIHWQALFYEGTEARPRPDKLRDKQSGDLEVSKDDSARLRIHLSWSGGDTGDYDLIIQNLAGP